MSPPLDRRVPILRSRLAVRALVLALAVALATAALPGATADAAARERTPDERRAESLLFDRHASARSDRGALWADDLAAVARDWSDRMARRGQMEHNLNGAASQLCCWTALAENVGRVGLGGGSVDQAVRTLFDAWMRSSSHASKITTTRYGHIGIGVTIDAGGSLWATVLFRTPVTGSVVATSEVYPDAPLPPPAVRSLARSCPSGVPASGFRDVTRYQREIDCAAWWGVTSGRTSGSFDPSGTVSRAQMATFVHQALTAAGASLPRGTLRFSDVEGVHAANIASLHAAGIIDGRSDGTFRPDDPVTRAQMASFLVASWRYLTGRLPPSPDGWRFADATRSAHRDAIERAAEAGWATGYPDGSFKPGVSMRREHLAVFLVRWLDSAVATGGASLPD